MTAADREALDALANRIVHAEALAKVIARTVTADHAGTLAMQGLATLIGDLSTRIDAIIDATRPNG